MANKIYQQKFYSLRTCMKIELNDGGTFFELSEVNQAQKKNGMATFKWDESAKVKFSVSELCLLSFVLKVYFGFEEFRLRIEDSEYLQGMSGPGAFSEMIKSFFPTNTYNQDKNTFFFTHKAKREGAKATSTGFAVSQGKIYFNISGVKRISFPVNQLEVLRMIQFIDWIVSKRFEMACFQIPSNEDEASTFSQQVYQEQAKHKKEQAEYRANHKVGK